MGLEVTTVVIDTSVFIFILFVLGKTTDLTLSLRSSKRTQETIATTYSKFIFCAYIAPFGPSLSAPVG